MGVNRDELSGWWLDTTSADIDQTAEKAIEYGSEDLLMIGRTMARIQGLTVTDAQAAELGILFYIYGKVARWVSAVKDGRIVSEDTLRDISIYAMMARRVREKGSWP